MKIPPSEAELGWNSIWSTASMNLTRITLKIFSLNSSSSFDFINLNSIGTGIGFTSTLRTSQVLSQSTIIK